ncbi:unnamed protein product [Trifolium pratense]|uniref:Uncharacterized protein n=1 Tax=Trifolium pratense TaxID=57577 RepID=A0ACB0K6L3_TRIPR|nr:unnamed protein product [Trifolium pratense]
MGREEKSKAKARDHEQQLDEISDNLDGASTPSLVFSGDEDDDDEEANQDLSLKIVEKALRTREAKLAPNDAVLNDIGSQQSEFTVTQNDDVLGGLNGVADMEVMEEKKMENLTVESGNQSVIRAAEQEVEEEMMKTTENLESVEASADQIGDNMVLRKLLMFLFYQRGPRYFDPPDSSWGACYNCGEEGHAAVNCTAAKRKKPCYVCGGLGHAAKQCTKAQSCYICKKGDHRAKDCPEKHTTPRASKSLTVCLKCGNSGHDMFSCRNDYSPDDLKEIQCYVCKTFGHLCCVNTADVILGEISCYKCGQMGHTGLACSRLQGETTGAATPTLCYRCGEGGHFARECTSSIKVQLMQACSRFQGETTGAATPTLCYRCGEGGHFARECTNSVKAGKKVSEFSSTKNRRSYKENDYTGHWSAPHDMGKMNKKKRPLTDERGFTTPKKSKRRGGWMTEFPTEERSFTTPKKSKSRGGRTRELPTEERAFKSPKKSKSRAGWMADHSTVERGFTAPKKSKNRGGWTTEHPTEERGFTTPKKSKSRGGWTMEHPAEERDFQTSMKFNSRGGWTTEHPGEFSYSKSNGSSWRSAGTTYARSTNMHASGSGSRIPGWNGQQPEASYFHHRYSASRFGNSNDDGYRRSNSASRFGNSSADEYRRNNWR